MISSSLERYCCVVVWETFKSSYSYLSCGVSNTCTSFLHFKFFLDTFLCCTDFRRWWRGRSCHRKLLRCHRSWGGDFQFKPAEGRVSYRLIRVRKRVPHQLASHQRRQQHHTLTRIHSNSRYHKNISSDSKFSSLYFLFSLSLSYSHSTSLFFIVFSLLLIWGNNYLQKLLFHF